MQKVLFMQQFLCQYQLHGLWCFNHAGVTHLNPTSVLMGTLRSDFSQLICFSLKALKIWQSSELLLQLGGRSYFSLFMEEVVLQGSMLYLGSPTTGLAPV